MTTLKTCFKCGLAKPRTEFYKGERMADGLSGKCKNCAKADVAVNRLENIEAIRQYDRTRAHLPHRMVRNVLVTTKWKAEFPERRAAQIALGNAIQGGRITPLPCLVCGERAEAHHPDYSRPLDVVWLCPAHHRQAHALARKVG
jgi:hypothetical protein